MMVQRPRQYGPPTPEVAAAEAEHDRMARNRAGTYTANTWEKPAKPVELHGADAFRRHTLEREVAERRAVHQAAQATMNAARGAAVTKRARRALNVALAKLNEAQLALRADIHGEPLAPAVRRQDLTQQGTVIERTGRTDDQGRHIVQRVVRDVVLRETQVAIRGQRVEVTPALERLRARETITAVEYHAGRRYREAWEKAGMDAYPIGLGSDGGKPAPASGNRRIEEAIGSGADLEAARRAIGVLGRNLVDHVVLNGFTIASWAEKKGQSEHVAKGYLKMVLTRLAEFWEEYDKGE